MNKPVYWPGTNIEKSPNNCFTQSFSGVPVNWAPLQVRAGRAVKLSARRLYSPEIEGRVAGAASTVRREAIRRGGI